MHPLAARMRFEQDASTLSPELARRRGWVIHSKEFPLFDCSFTGPKRTPFRVRLHCEQWNDEPPSVTLHDAGGEPLRVLPSNPTGVFNGGPHPSTNRPFVCMRGSKEYHTHPSHIDDPWAPLKDNSSYTLGGIVTQLWNAWRKGSG